MGNDQTSADLDAAASYLESHGWQQGNAGIHGGPRCVSGALCSATFTGSGFAPTEASLALAIHLRVDRPLSLIRWNDAPGRTAAEVIAALRAAAEEVRRG